LALLALLAFCGPLDTAWAQEGGAPLRAALETVGHELAVGSPAAGRFVVAAPEGASVLDGYAAEMLSFFLAQSGARSQLCRLERIATPRELPADRLPKLALAVLGRGGAASAVLVRVAGEPGAYRLEAAAYSLRDGQRETHRQLAVRLTDDLAFLADARSHPLPEADARWLEGMTHLFPQRAPDPRQPQAAARRAEGRYLFRSGLWDQAAARLLPVRQGSPDGCLLRIVLALGQVDRWREAAGLVEDALADHPDSGPLYALKAWIKLRRGAPDDALLLLGEARIWDLRREGYYWLARYLVSVELRQEEESERFVTMAAGFLPDEPLAQLTAARFFWRRADLEEAVVFYKHAVLAGPTIAENWTELGGALYAAGRTRQAQDTLRHALELDPGNAGAARHLCSILRSAGHSQEALEVLRSASEARPERVELLAAYGDMAAQMWRTDDAQRAYELSFARDPEFHAGKVGLALMLARRRRHAEAQQLLADLLQAHPDYQPARLALGRMLADQGETGQAIEALAEGIRDPDYEARVRLAMAHAFYRAGQYAEAERSARIALAAEPTAGGYATLARIFMALEQWDKAETAVGKALETSPGLAVSQLAAAQLARARERYQEALASAEQAVELDPFCVDAHELAGRLCLRLNKSRKCIQLWERALELNPWDAQLHWETAEALRTKRHDMPGAVRHYLRHVELGGAHAEEAARLLAQSGAPEPGN